MTDKIKLTGRGVRAASLESSTLYIILLSSKGTVNLKSIFIRSDVDIRVKYIYIFF